jgi:hypothetical protein
MKIPPVLAVRLGPDASKGLVEVLDVERKEWSDTVLTAVSERFERRLIEEGAKFRVELATLGSDLRQEMARDRFELLKWMFVFWIGQLAAMSAIMSFLLRR